MEHKTFSEQDRGKSIQKLSDELSDVLVVGGGINGAVSIAACAKAGLKCALIEKKDFGSMTSQASSNLVWGGIKYLENFEFPLVMKLCASRNRLMRNFPSIVQEIRFFTLHEIGFRFPLWFLYLGTWVYEIVGRFKTRFPRLISKQRLAKEAPFANRKIFDGGFEYSDAILPENDSRFVLNFITKAVDAGAIALNYCELKTAVFKNEIWHCVIRDHNGSEFEIRTRSIINAAGPYVDSLNQEIGIQTPCSHLFSKGIHLIFPRFDENRRVITSFADDGRLFFAIPMGNRTCVGTTDTIVEDPAVGVTEEDREFLLKNINRILTFSKPLTKEDIIAERCGVRPLAVEQASGNNEDADWFKLSRKHILAVNDSKRTVSIFGGKLTDCLNVGEEILELLKKSFHFSVKNFNLDILGEPGVLAKQKFLDDCKKSMASANLPDKDLFCERLWRRYSDRAEIVLELIRKDSKMLEPIGEGIDIYRIDEEMAYGYEMAMNREDFFRRRTLGSMTHREEELSACALTRF